ncbi:DUF2190 family protein [Acidihalobacter prosperus]|uniref:DUF2190 domain-containing protein n=1 Tax=Acidihalobacter prosperus TaxID=160660 RepID=A0A1A6C8A0_9GAMM|nr:DUF2190 family protein [Acidihalobacter prosperus]OBS10792.1 DUF2190 domain-containing protein [Acidihalobacter prosperus]
MGRQSLVNLSLTLKATTAITQHRGVGFDGAQASAQGQKVLGVAHFDAVIGDEVTVDVDDTVLVEAGAAIAIGDALIMDAQGRAIPSTGEIGVAAGATAVTSSAANGAILTGGIMPEYVFADALEAATAAGQIIEVITRR